MSENKKPPEGDGRSRQFLEELLAQYRRAEMPGDQQLIEAIEMELAELPPETDGTPEE